MFVNKLEVGNLATNCYIIGDVDNKKAVVIDPGGDADKILDVIKKHGFHVEFIILTHGHGDHIGGLEKVREATGAKVAVHKKDAPMLHSATANLSKFIGSGVELTTADIYLNGGESFTVGGLKLQIIHTPGHTPGGISIKIDNVIFTGDTLFAGSIGRTDFPGGSYKQLLDSIKKKLLNEPDDTKIFPGHGPESAIGEEKRFNPFL
jgi:hydroxyacylglutathione hydrolase